MWVKKATYVLIFLWLVIILLVFRLYYVAFGNLNERVRETAGSHSATKVLYNSKGIVYDRNLVAVAGEQDVYYLVVDPRRFDSSMTEYICSLTSFEREALTQKLTKETPFVLQSYIKPQEIDGVYVYEGSGRYPQDRVAEHLIGYLDSDGVVGQAGIEKAYDSFLSQYESSVTYSYSANAVRGVIPQLDITTDQTEPSTDGLVLTIDKQLSEFAQNSLKEYTQKGCVIVMDCNNGELLTLSSVPGYDAANIQKYQDSSNGELINNALVNQTVGSVFKIVVAASACINGLDGFEFECKGATSVSQRTFTCQNQTVHGKQNIDDAFSNSCNCYFISLGQLLGYDKILETAQLLGVDSSIRIAKDIYSVSGIIPEDEGILALANLSIGQGELMISPLAMSRVTAAICNGGYLVNPTVYLGTCTDGEIFNKSEYSYKNIVLSESVAKRIKDMCIGCVENGTGKTAKPGYGGAGGKTASAQTGMYNKDGSEILNTCFTGFYPAESPQYVITVFAADGKSGSATCAPVFKEICDFIQQNY